MAKIIKILSLGISQSNFLGQLYGDLQDKYENYKVGINNYYDVTKGQVPNKKDVFIEYFKFEKEIVTRFQSIRSFIELSLTKEFWEIYFFERSQDLSIKESYYFLRSFAYDKIITEKYILKTDYNIHHFHYCTPANLKYIHHFPKDKKVICSFWGSDLMRETGVANVFYVKKALDRANVITIQNVELAEMLYCKYGRELQNKTKIIQFTIHTKIYDFIDLLRNNTERIENFKTNYNIPHDKIVITVSHNAFAANNHFNILEVLEELSSQLKSMIVVVLPLGYGRNDEYIHRLERYKESSKIELVLLHQFFGPKETAFLRLCTDLMIQMPISDALSGAMTEVLYAGNHVIVGAWLPYGLLRRNGINYTEIEKYNELGGVIENYLNNPTFFRDTNNTNPDNIKVVLFPDKTTADWNSLFSNLL